MRWKIIIANAGIVFVVGLLAYSILLTTLGDALSDRSERKAAAERAANSANAQLTLEGLTVERWLSKQTARDEIATVFSLGTQAARNDAATSQANKLMDTAAKASEFAGMQPVLVLFVDNAGVALGRNSNALMRGDNMGKIYPSLALALASGQSESAVWYNPQRQEQLFASYVPVRGDGGAIVGAVVVGTPINDDRLARTSRQTSGTELVVVAKNGQGKFELIAGTRDFPSSVSESATTASALARINESNKVRVLEQAAEEFVVGVAPLRGYAGAGAGLMTAVPRSLVGNLSRHLWPIWGVTALGLLMVFAAGIMIAAYISRPINQLEEGLLMIINGKTDMRFELEHPELGGLVYRINSLLNALTGVPEGDNDASSGD